MNFWDYSSWGFFNLMTILLASLLIAQMLKRSIPALEASLIPTSVLGGGVLLVISAIFKAITGEEFFDTNFFGGNGSAWLELLRVHPEYQRKGCGMAIYKRYMEQLEEMGCPAARMYTGARNVPSAALAERHGLHRSTEFHGMTLTMDKADASLFWEPPMYRRLNGDEAIMELLPMKEQLGGYLGINQTYYEINEETLRGFAAAGWIYGDGKGNVLVAGTRFQPNKALYIAAMKGDKRRALSYALNMMVMAGHQKIAAHFPVGEGAQEMIDFLAKHGFEQNPSDLVVMEWTK